MPLRQGRQTLALALIALACFGAVAIALFSQHVLGMWPCAWCIFQRLLFIVIGLVALLGLLSANQAYRRLICAAIVVLSGAGVAAAWHQTTVAAQLFSCDQTFADRVVVGSGLESAMPWLFGIYASCMDAAVRFLGLEYSLWSLLLYVVLACMAIYAWFAGAGSKRR
jgi:disulfide bond formation protein DsbB